MISLIILTALDFSVVIMLLNSKKAFYSIFAALLISCVIYVLYIALNSTIIIDADGLKYKSRKIAIVMKWDEIGKVSIYRHIRGLAGGFKAISFTRIIDGKVSPDSPAINNDYVIIGFNRKIIKLVNLYWNNEIEKPTGLILK